MTQNVVSAMTAQKWANLVVSCCPGVARAEWHVGFDEVAIRTWFTPCDCEPRKQSPEMVEIVVSCDTVDDYICASKLAQFRADINLVEFVTMQYLQHGPADSEVAGPEQWSVTSASLGLQPDRARRRRFWNSLVH